MIRFNPNRAYNDLPLLPPKQDLETRTVLKHCIEARVALSELQVAGELIPNQAMLINTIPLLEARDSSTIENIVTTADALFRSENLESQKSVDSATKETLRYKQALYIGFRSLEKSPLTTNTAVEVCRMIRGADLDIRKVPGTALANDRTRDVIYTPPEGEDVLREKLANWEQFIHTREEIDPLVRMAVMHYQFEAIHPFTDGNGRTGRILNVLFLIDKQLLSIPVLYLSRFLIRNKSDYYRFLLQVTKEGQWEQWVLYMLEAVAQTARWTTKLIREIRDLMDETIRQVKEKCPGIYSRELVELIFVQPYCRIGNLVEMGIAKRQSASKYLKQLAEIGLLREIQVGREKLFIHSSLIHLLTEEEKVL